MFIHMRMLQNPKAVREGGSGPGINTKQCLPSVPLCFVIISIEFQSVKRRPKMFESLSNSTGCLKACKIQYSCIIGFVFYTSLLQYRKTPAVKAGSIKVEENVL